MNSKAVVEAVRWGIIISIVIYVLGIFGPVLAVRWFLENYWPEDLPAEQVAEQTATRDFLYAVPKR